MIKSKINFCFAGPEGILKDEKIDQAIINDITKSSKDIEEIAQLIKIIKCNLTAPYVESCVKNVAGNLKCGVSADGKICTQCFVMDCANQLEKKVKLMTRKTTEGKLYKIFKQNKFYTYF